MSADCAHGTRQTDAANHSQLVLYPTYPPAAFDHGRFHSGGDSDLDRISIDAAMDRTGHHAIWAQGIVRMLRLLFAAFATYLLAACSQPTQSDDFPRAEQRAAKVASQKSKLAIPQSPLLTEAERSRDHVYIEYDTDRSLGGLRTNARFEPATIWVYIISPRWKLDKPGNLQKGRGRNSWEDTGLLSSEALANRLAPTMNLRCFSGLLLIT